MPEKLAQMKETFAIEFARNNGYPVGGGLWVLLHPEYRVSSPYTEWTFPGRITGMPEFTAPRLGSVPNLVTIDADAPADADGVLYSLGAFSGGLTCYVQNGILCYEYNLFEIARTQIKAAEKMVQGKVKIEVQTTYVGTPRACRPTKRDPQDKRRRSSAG